MLIGRSLYIASGVLLISRVILGYEVLLERHTAVNALVPILSFIVVAAVEAPVFESYGRRTQR